MGAREISNRGRDYKWGQERFQIGAGITNWCRTTPSQDLKIQLCSYYLAAVEINTYKKAW